MANSAPFTSILHHYPPPLYSEPLPLTFHPLTAVPQHTITDCLFVCLIAVLSSACCSCFNLLFPSPHPASHQVWIWHWAFKSRESISDQTPKHTDRCLRHLCFYIYICKYPVEFCNIPFSSSASLVKVYHWIWFSPVVFFLSV